MSRRRKWGTFLAATLTAAALLAGCGSAPKQTQPSPAPEQKQAGPWDGTITIGLVSNPTALDPRISLEGYARTIYFNGYNSLLIVKPGTTSDMIGDLAQTWNVSADGLTWTFPLKPEAKFWDGTPVDANAVKFTFDTMMKLNQGPAANFRVVKEVQAVDATTVKFVMSAPFAAFPTLLPDIGIINPKVMEHQENGDFGSKYLANNLMGSGPFKLKEWKPNQYLTLEAVPNYWGANKPKPKQVVYKITTEASNLRLQLEKGDLDIARGIPTDQMLSMVNKPGIKVQDDVGFDFIYVYLNNQKKPLDNPKVRQALAYAADTESIVKDLLKGHGRVLKGPFAEGFEGYQPPSFYYKRDVARAKQLLSEAGLAGGFSFTLLHASATIGGKEAAQVLQANWAEIGVKVQLQELAEATRRQMVDKGDFEASMGQWIASAPVPYWTLNIWHESARFGLAGDRSFYKNAQVDDLLARASAEMDAGKRAGLYLQAQEQILPDAPYVYLYQRNAVLPMRAELKGYQYNPVPYRINVADLSK